jgi:hypothetical protein
VSFLVYYGHDPALLPRLKEADLVILESQGWSDSQLGELRDAGTTVVGYISPLAWADWKGSVKWWWGKKERDEAWNAWWLSLASRGWRWSVGRACRHILGRTNGLFFDNLDRFQQDRASVKPFVGILKSLREHCPEAVLIGNRGFAHWSRLQRYLDGVLFENMTDKAFGAKDRGWVREQLLDLPQSKVYALDYSTRCDVSEAGELRQAYPKMQYYCAPDETLQGLN